MKLIARLLLALVLVWIFAGPLARLVVYLDDLAKATVWWMR